MDKKVYAVDVGGTAIKIARFTYDGALEETFSIKTDRSENGKHVFRDIAQAIKGKTPDLKSIAGIAVGVPGPVKGTTVYGAVNIGWGETDVGKRMKACLGADVPIYVDNDVNLAGLGEFHAHKDVDSMVLLALGTGIGGGIVIGGRIHTGHNAAAGEFGHMKLYDDGPVCGCGNTGCFETFASANAVRRLAQKAIEEGADTVMGSMAPLNAKKVFDAAKQGDKSALKIVDDVSATIAKAVQIITVSYDPEAVFIGGGLSKAGDFLIDRIAAHYESIAFKNVAHTPIRQASLIERAQIYGGYALVMHHG